MSFWDIGIGEIAQTTQKSNVPRYMQDLCYDPTAQTFYPYDNEETYISSKRCLCAQLLGMGPEKGIALDFILNQNPIKAGLILELLEETSTLTKSARLLQADVFPTVTESPFVKTIKKISPCYVQIAETMLIIFTKLNEIIADVEKDPTNALVSLINYFISSLKHFSNFITLYLNYEQQINNFSYQYSPQFSSVSNNEPLIVIIKSPIVWIQKTTAILEEYLELSQLSESQSATFNQFIRDARTLHNSLETTRQLEEVASKFVVEPFPIVQNGRRLIKQGTAVKQCRKRQDSRTLILLSDMFVYTHVKGGLYISPGVYDLVHLRVELVSLDSSLFGMNVYAPKKSFLLLFVTEGERTEWFEAISQSIQIARDNQPTPVEQYWEAPVWIPDQFARKCMICQEQFSVFNRKHHCRLCGKVICSKCSNNKIILANISQTKPNRVCDECYTKSRDRTESLLV